MPKPWLVFQAQTLESPISNALSELTATPAVQAWYQRNFGPKQKMLEHQDIRMTDQEGETSAADAEDMGAEDHSSADEARVTEFKAEDNGLSNNPEMPEPIPEHYLYRGRRRPWQTRKVRKTSNHSQSPSLLALKVSRIERGCSLCCGKGVSAVGIEGRVFLQLQSVLPQKHLQFQLDQLLH